MPLDSRSSGDLTEVSKLRSLLRELEEEDQRSNNLPSLLQNLNLYDKEKKTETEKAIRNSSSQVERNDKEILKTFLTAKGVEPLDDQAGFGRKTNESTTQSTSNFGNKTLQEDKQQLPQLQIDDPDFINVKRIIPAIKNSSHAVNNLTNTGNIKKTTNLSKSLTIDNRPQYSPSRNVGVSYTVHDQGQLIEVSRPCVSLNLPAWVNYASVSRQSSDYGYGINDVYINTQSKLGHPEVPVIHCSPPSSSYTQFKLDDCDSLPQNVVTDAYYPEWIPSRHSHGLHTIDCHDLNNICPSFVIPDNERSTSKRDLSHDALESNRRTPCTYIDENVNKVTGFSYIEDFVLPSIPPDHSLNHLNNNVSPPAQTGPISSSISRNDQCTVTQTERTSINTEDTSESCSRVGTKRPLSPTSVLAIDKKYEDEDGNTPLHNAIEVLQDETQSKESRKRAKLVIYKMECWKELIHSKNHFDQTPLFIAVKFNMKEEVEHLLEGGADVNEQGLEESTRQYMTPLHIAAKNGEKGLNVMRVLLKVEEIDVNRESLNCRSVPLHMAIESKWIEGIEMLIARGCSVLSEDDKSYTPLMLAVQTKDLEIIRLILTSVPMQERRDYVNIVNKSGNTCLHLAAGLPKVDDQVKVQILRFLIKNHADVDAINKDNETAQDIANPQMKEVLAQYRVPTGTWRGRMEHRGANTVTNC